MRNITEQQKAEARAYNDTIKHSMSIKNKLELLYIDLIAYVANELGAEKMEALNEIVNIFKINPYPWSIDDEIEVILYGYNRVKNGYSDIRYFKEDMKIELEVVDEYYSYFYQDLEHNLNKIIDNYSESLESKVAELIAKK